MLSLEMDCESGWNLFRGVWHLFLEPAHGVEDFGIWKVDFFWIDESLETLLFWDLPTEKDDFYLMVDEL